MSGFKMGPWNHRTGLGWLRQFVSLGVPYLTASCMVQGPKSAGKRLHLGHCHCR